MKSSHNSGYAWRDGRPILPLSTFDYLSSHTRSLLDIDFIYSVSESRMSGWRFSMNPIEIRDAIRSGKLNKHQLAYLSEVFSQLDGVDFKLFIHKCGASIYEVARTMSMCKINDVFVREFMNTYSEIFDNKLSPLPPYIVSGSIFHSFTSGLVR